MLKKIKNLLDKVGKRVNEQHDDFYVVEISETDYYTFSVYEMVNFVGNEVTVIEIMVNDDPKSVDYIHDNHLSQLKALIE